MKKGVGAALAAALVALVSHGAGCSDDSLVPYLPPDGEGGALGADAGARHPQGDAGGGGDDGATGDDCPAPAPTKADLDQPDGAPGWNPPKPRQTTACSPNDLQRFAANMESPSLVTWDDAVGGLPTTCAQCILSRESDASWQVIVTDATGKDGFVNWGACYADAPHGSPACGQAAAYLHYCIEISCAGCATASNFDACTSSKAVDDACAGAFGPAVQASCPQAYAQELDAQCGRIVDVAAIVCGDGTLPDGGKLTD